MRLEAPVRGAPGSPSPRAERPCSRCLDGYVPLSSTGGRKIYYEECPICRGTTRVEAFVYPRPATWRGVWPTETALAGREGESGVDHLFDHLSIGVLAVRCGSTDLPKSGNRLSTGVHGGL